MRGDFIWLYLFDCNFLLQRGLIDVGFTSLGFTPFHNTGIQIKDGQPLGDGNGNGYDLHFLKIFRFYNWAERLGIENLMRRSKAQKKEWKSHNPFI